MFPSVGSTFFLSIMSTDDSDARDPTEGPRALLEPSPTWHLSLLPLPVTMGALQGLLKRNHGHRRRDSRGLGRKLGFLQEASV